MGWAGVGWGEELHLTHGGQESKRRSHCRQYFVRVEARPQIQTRSTYIQEDPALNRKGLFFRQTNSEELRHTASNLSRSCPDLGSLVASYNSTASARAQRTTQSALPVCSRDPLQQRHPTNGHRNKRLPLLRSLIPVGLPGSLRF